MLKVKDWDRGFGGDDSLGSVSIPADTLYNFGNEPKEFKLDPPSGRNEEAGFIKLSCSQISAAERDSRKKGFFKGFRAGECSAAPIQKYVSGLLTNAFNFVTCQEISLVM